MSVEWLRVVPTAAVFLGVIGLAELWRARSGPPTEWTRKFVHLCGGLLVLAFPWIFERVASVIVLAGAFAVLIAITRRSAFLRSIHDVDRRSEGGVLYPAAVILVFGFAHDRPALYLAAMLSLIVSDAAAALLGSVYGRTTYEVESDRRSIEGSSVFLLATFLAVHLPLLLMTDVARPVSVLLALHVAIVVTLLEGISLRGCDNLTIPVSVYYLLDRFADVTPEAVARHLLAVSCILVLLGVLAWRSRILTASGVMAAGIFFYAVYTLGEPGWVCGPAVALLGLAALRAHRGNVGVVPAADFQVVATFYATVVGVALLVLHDVVPLRSWSLTWGWRSDTWATLFFGAMAAQLSVVAVSQIRPFGPANRHPPALPIVLALSATSAGLVGSAGIWLGGGLSPDAVITVGALAVVAAVTYWQARRVPGWPAVAPWNMRLQAASVGLATLLALPLHLLLTT